MATAPAVTFDMSAVPGPMHCRSRRRSAIEWGGMQPIGVVDHRLWVQTGVVGESADDGVRVALGKRTRLQSDTGVDDALPIELEGETMEISNVVRDDATLQ